MTIRTKAALKAFFETNDTPSESNFIDLIDTLAELTSGEWQDYGGTSTIVGWSSYTIKKIYFRTISDIVFIQFEISGTSDDTVATFTLPHAALMSLNLAASFRATDDDTNIDWGFLLVANGSSTVTLYKDVTQVAAGTASGGKSCVGEFWYEK